MSVSFTQEQVRQLQDTQRALLSLQLNADFTAWATSVFEALRPLLSTAHLYYLQPADRDGWQNEYSNGDPAVSHNGLSSPAGTTSPQDPEPALIVHGPSLGEDFARGINRHFVGFENGFSTFRETYPTTMHRLVRAAGAGAVHDAPLYDRKRREQLTLYQEVFRPTRVDRQLALAVPLPQGEALLIAGFSADRSPDYDGARHQMMRLLAPAFETSLQLQRRFAIAHQHVTATLDALPEAIIAFDADGAERYRNKAFRRIPTSEAERDPLARAAHTLADELRATLRRSAPRRLSTMQRDVSLPSGCYDLRAFFDVSLLADPGVLVIVERTSPLPPPVALQRHFGLTPREAEVALLMAQGLPDREVADSLVISPHTARRHAEKVLKKMGLSSRAGVALACMHA